MGAVGSVLLCFWLLALRLDAKADPVSALDGEIGFVEAEETEKIPLSVVTRGPATPAALAPAVVDVITAEEIRASGARTLAELLSQRVGVDALALDAPLDTVGLRGLAGPIATTSNSRSLLLINGRRVNGAALGDFFAGRELPLEHLARIEIIRGPGSALYGTNAVSAVINAVTKDAADMRGVSVIGEYGSFSSRRVDLFGGAGVPRRNANFFFRHFGSAAPEDLDQEFGTDVLQYYGFGRGEAGPLTIEGEASSFESELETGDSVQRVTRDRYSVGASLDQPLYDEFRLSGRAYANLLPRPNDQRQLFQELSLHHRSTEWLSVTFGGEAREEKASGDFPETIERSRNSFGAFLEDEVRLPGNATLVGGFRYDAIERVRDRVSPRVYFLWRPQQAMTLRLGYGEGFRAPGLLEPFIFPGPEGSESRVLSDVARTVDAELSHRFSRSLNGRLGIFYTRGSNFRTLSSLDCPTSQDPVDCLVLALAQGQSPATVTTFVPGSVRVFGLEGTLGGILKAPLPGELAYGLNYTFLDTRNRFSRFEGDPPEEMPVESDVALAPSHKMNAVLRYRPVERVSVFWHSRWVDRQMLGLPDESGNELVVPSFLTHTMRLTFRFSREIEFGIGFHNLTNEGPKVNGRRLQPFTVLGSVTYRFSPAPFLPECPWKEPEELGQARRAVEEARAAGAERVSGARYGEALERLAGAETLMRKCVEPKLVVAAARQAIEAATQARGEIAAPPPPPRAPAPPVELAQRKVLVVQSDGKVTSYQQVSRALVPKLGTEVLFYDCQGDPEGCRATLRERAGDADLVLPIGITAARGARETIRDRQVLYCGVSNPKRHDLLTQNVCGISLDVAPHTFLERLRDAFPERNRIGVLYDPTKSGAYVLEAERAATNLGLQIIKSPVRDPRDVEFAFRAVAADVQLLWLIRDSTVITTAERFDQLVERSLEVRVPLVTSFPSERGVLLAVSVEPETVGEECAGLAQRLLRLELSCNEVGYAWPRRVSLHWNRSLAEHFGVNVPGTTESAR